MLEVDMRVLLIVFFFYDLRTFYLVKNYFLQDNIYGSKIFI